MSKQVLVTGVSGFVAAYIVKDLLEAGYKVIGTVRSLQDKSKYEHLLAFPHAAENLKLVEADLLKDGSFDEAAKGCVAIFHAASPYFFPSATTNVQEELIAPALQGTKNVLQAAEKARDTVKRVVVTSSTAAVSDMTRLVPGKLYSEEDWNETASETNNGYAYSKVLAEKEAWNFTKELQAKYGAENTFDLVTINPPLITGPVLAVKRVKSGGVKELNTSCKNIRTYLLLKKLDPQNAAINTSRGMGTVDVRDVARVHRLAYEVKEAGMKRFVCASIDDHVNQWATVCLWLREAYPQFSETIPDEFIGDFEEGKKAIIHLNASRVQQVLGVKDFIPLKQSILDTAQSLIENDLVTGIQ